MTDTTDTTDTTAKATRTAKTPANRAQEAVDVLQRRLDRLTAQRGVLEDQLRNVALDELTIQKRLEYAQASPDLDATKYLTKSGSGLRGQI